MSWEVLSDDRWGKTYTVALENGKPKYASFTILAAVQAVEPLVECVRYTAPQPGRAEVLVYSEAASEATVDAAMADFAV